jgi:F-type H+-transporting ATPase subunit b
VINPNITIVIQIINFLILLFALNHLLYKPILKKIREREAQIKQDQENARDLEQQVAAQETRHQEELAKARQTAAQDKQSMLAVAKGSEAEILNKARGESGRIVNEMKEAIQKDAEEVRKNLRTQMTPLAKSIAQKILGRAVA